MYLDGFHFSPFKIDKNIISIWNDLVIIKNEKIYCQNKIISPEEFYDLFLEKSKYAWFVNDFIKFFECRKKAIPGSVAEFAVYCQSKFTFLSDEIFCDPPPPST